MAKSKKKRTKQYSGANAAQSRPVVHQYEAVERSRVGQWTYEHKGRIKIFGVLALIVLVITLIISGIVTVLQ